MLSLLDIGCGPKPKKREGYRSYGLDIVPSPENGVRAADLTWEGIPFSHNTFDRVLAYDFLEHIPMRIYYREVNRIWKNDDLIDMPTIEFGYEGRTRNCMIELFNEVYRVLKPGGVFETFTPHLWTPPNMALQEMYRDPTHVSVWVEQSWEYWAGSMTNLMRHYGYRADFTIMKKERRGAHYYVELRKNEI